MFGEKRLKNMRTTGRKLTHNRLAIVVRQELRYVRRTELVRSTAGGENRDAAPYRIDVADASGEHGVTRPGRFDVHRDEIEQAFFEQSLENLGM